MYYIYSDYFFVDIFVNNKLEKFELYIFYSKIFFFDFPISIFFFIKYLTTKNKFFTDFLKKIFFFFILLEE